MPDRHRSIVVFVAAAWLGLTGSLGPGQTPPTSASASATEDVEALVAAIRDAKDAPAAAAAYNRLAQMEKQTPAAHNAYMRRMLQLGMPQAAQRGAYMLAGRDSTNGMALGVTAYLAGKRGKYDEALPAAVRSALYAPDDPSAQNNAGQLIAWYEALKNPPRIDDALKRAIARAKEDLSGKKPYDQARARVQGLLDKHQTVVAAIQKIIADLKAELDTLEKSAQELDSKYTALNNKINAEQEVIDQLQVQLSSVNATIVRSLNSNPNVSVASLQAQAADLKMQISQETAVLNDLKEQRARLQAEGAKLMQKVREKNAAIAAQQKQLEATPNLVPAFRWDPPAVDGVVTEEVIAAPATAGSSASKPTHDDPEAVAANKLQLARNYISNGMADPAVAALNEIIAQYPDTKAAAEAKALLQSVTKP